MKVCHRCEQEKPFQDFNKAAGRADGLQVYCKACLKAYRLANASRKSEVDKAYRAANVEKIAERRHAYYEANKAVIAAKRREYLKANRQKVAASLARYRNANKERLVALRKAYYWRNPEKAREAALQWARQNKQHVAEYKRSYREANLETVRKKGREYVRANRATLTLKYKANKAKRRAAGKMISAADIGRLLKLQRHRCAICCAGIKKKFHLDHILPIALGGKNEWSNFQCLCPACNLSKSKKHPIDYMQQIGMLL